MEDNKDAVIQINIYLPTVLFLAATINPTNKNKNTIDIYKIIEEGIVKDLLHCKIISSLRVLFKSSIKLLYTFNI
jgi:hypothetical protein